MIKFIVNNLGKRNIRLDYTESEIESLWAKGIKSKGPVTLDGIVQTLSGHFKQEDEEGATLNLPLTVKSITDFSNYVTKETFINTLKYLGMPQVKGTESVHDLQQYFNLQTYGAVGESRSVVTTSDEQIDAPLGVSGYFVFIFKGQVWIFKERLINKFNSKGKENSDWAKINEFIKNVPSLISGFNGIVFLAVKFSKSQNVSDFIRISNMYSAVTADVPFKTVFTELEKLSDIKPFLITHSNDSQVYIDKDTGIIFQLNTLGPHIIGISKCGTSVLTGEYYEDGRIVVDNAPVQLKEPLDVTQDDYFPRPVMFSRRDRTGKVKSHKSNNMRIFTKFPFHAKLKPEGNSLYQIADTLAMVELNDLKKYINKKQPVEDELDSE